MLDIFHIYILEQIRTLPCVSDTFKQESMKPARWKESVVSRMVAILIMVPVLSCSSYRYSNKADGEQTHMTPLMYEEPVTLAQIVETNNPDASTRALVSTEMLIQGANLAVQGVKYLIDESQKKYHAEYMSGLSNQNFYAANSMNGMLDPDGIAFKGFRFDRTFEDPETGEQLAISATFSLDESKMQDIYFNSKFYFVLDSLDIGYSKVKVNDTRWYMPWTWFLKKEKAFNMDITIDILASWIDETGQIHSDVQFGQFVLPLRNIPLDPDSDGRKEWFDAMHGTAVTGSSYIIPRSTTFCSDHRGNLDPCFGRGDFSIVVKATESSKEDFVSKLIQDNSDAIFDNIKGEDVIKVVKPKN